MIQLPLAEEVEETVKTKEGCQKKWKSNPDISFQIQMVSQSSMWGLFDLKKDIALLIFLGKWVTGMALFFVCLFDQKESYRRTSKQIMTLIRLTPVQRKEAIKCWYKQVALGERSVQCSFEMLIPSCLNLVAWFSFELFNKCMAVGRVWRKHKSSHHLNCSSAVVEPMASRGAAWSMALGTKREQFALNCASNKSKAVPGMLM